MEYNTDCVYSFDVKLGMVDLSRNAQRGMKTFELVSDDGKLQ
jgi:hypothetical protein